VLPRWRWRGSRRATQSTSATAVDLCHEPPGPKILLEVDPKVTAASRPSQRDPACRIHRGGGAMHSVARAHRWRLGRDREGEGVLRADCEVGLARLPFATEDFPRRVFDGRTGWRVSDNADRPGARVARGRARCLNVARAMTVASCSRNCSSCTSRSAIRVSRERSSGEPKASSFKSTLTCSLANRNLRKIRRL
jgi:hypothetical protein